jgi:hypothetical protein
MTMYLLFSVSCTVGTVTVPLDSRISLPRNISGNGNLDVLGIDLRHFIYSVRSLVDILTELQ